jgi:hypothetical protein
MTRVTKNTFTVGTRYRIRTNYGAEYEAVYQGTGYYPAGTLVFVEREGMRTHRRHIRPSQIVSFEEAK